MQQLTQQLKSGQIEIRELPFPQIGPGMILVRNHFSLISAGTESSTVKTARKSLLGKAKERPQQVKQVLDTLRQQGPVQTYRAVMKKLDAYSPLGYSSAGVVLEVGDGVSGFQAGDRVACAGGGYANHAEVVSVPENLCVKLPADADLSLAAFNTLGAIALQGVRQADLRLGESCVVIGLGLLGQLTCLLLRSAGVKVFGVDVDQTAVKTAAEHCADFAWVRGDATIENTILSQTNGIGADAVIITAATDSLDPVNFAGAISRKKGKVVIVGAVPTGFDRNPHYYPKELDLRMSCSYGPGRYDPDYEEGGLDYPAAYVRWTENRNMQAFQELIHSGKINLNYLVTHRFDLNRAAEAYEMILNKSEPFLGVLLKYDNEYPLQRGTIKIKEPSREAQSKVGLAFVGAGSYAQGNLLPNIPQDSAIRRINILTNSGTTSRRVAERFGFESCTDQEADIFESPDVNTVFIATRHDTHGSYTQKALKHDKSVFVEKPLCLSLAELIEIEAQYATLADSGKTPMLMVGFNRRFSPLSQDLKKMIGDAPLSLIYRVNAGAIPPESWIQDLKTGGGRIIGEVCHFIDYAIFMTRSLPVRVVASRLPDPFGHSDTVSITMEFQNGSIATVHYFANGNKALSKERIEVYQAGACAVLDDFRRLEYYGRKVINKKLPAQDKGQKAMMQAVFNSLKTGAAAPVSPKEIFDVHRAIFAVLWSLHPARRDDEIYATLLQNRFPALARVPWPRTNRAIRGATEGSRNDLRPEYHEYIKWSSGPLYAELNSRIDPDWFETFGIFDPESIRKMKKLVKASQERVGPLNRSWLWLAGFRTFTEYLEENGKNVRMHQDWPTAGQAVSDSGSLLQKMSIYAAGTTPLLNTLLRTVRKRRRVMQRQRLCQEALSKYPTVQI